MKKIYKKIIQYLYEKEFGRDDEGRYFDEIDYKKREEDYQEAVKFGIPVYSVMGNIKAYTYKGRTCGNRSFNP